MVSLKEEKATEKKPISEGDQIKCLITNSDFYLPNVQQASQPPWFSPGDYLIVKVPKKGETASLCLQNRDKQQLEFSVLDKGCKVITLSEMSLFVCFDVVLENYDNAKWRFELFCQRLPAKSTNKPNNQDMEVKFNFFTIDNRFGDDPTATGNLQSRATDGSGGGFAQ